MVLHFSDRQQLESVFTSISLCVVNAPLAGVSRARTRVQVACS